MNTGLKTKYKEVYRGVEVRLLVLLALSQMLPNMRGSCILPPRCCPVSLGRRDINPEIEIFPKAGQAINVSTAIHALDVELTPAISPSSGQSIRDHFVLKPSRGPRNRIIIMT